MSEVVDPGGAGDRLSLNAWEAADADADAICTTSDNSADTAAVTIDFGNAFTITAQAGDEAQKDGWKTDRYRLDVANLAMQVAESGTIDGLQIRAVTTGGSDVTIYGNASGDTINMSACRLHNDDSGTNGNARIIYHGAGRLNIWNTILAREDTVNIQCINTQGSADAYIYNCTLYRGNDTIDHDSSGTMRVRNCAIIDSNDDFGSPPDTIDSCLGEDGDGTNSQTPASGDWDNEFADVSTYDFTLLEDGNAENNGADLSEDSDLAVTDDMEGDERGDPPDIGVDEFAEEPAGVTVEPGVGELVITGFAPTVTATANVTASPGLAEVAITGLAPTVTASDHQTASPGVSVVVITGFAPTVSVSDNQTVSPGVSAVSITGFAPTVSTTANVSVSPGVSAIGLTGLAPTVSVTGHQVVSPGVGALSLTGFAPTVSTTGHQVVSPGVSVLSLTGLAPTVTTGGNQVVQPGVSAMSYTGYAPTVATTGNVTVSPGVAAVTLAGLAPTVTVTANVTVSPGLAQLLLTGLQPTVSVAGSVTVEPGLAELLLAGFAPTVTATAVLVAALEDTMFVPKDLDRATIPGDGYTMFVPEDVDRARM